MRSSKFINNLLLKLNSWAASKYFFGAVLTIFFAGASWIATTAVFPGAFDEDAHLGIIKIFAAHPNPFFNTQPTYLDHLGPVVHDPQYIYHFLMSFPWRLITLITDSSTTQIIFMRLINVALFGIGLVLLRKVLVKLTGKPSLANLSLLLFVLTPMVPQLAAQINYDNLIVPLLALTLLLAFDIKEDFEHGKVNVWRLGLFLSLGFMTILVKYAYLTLFATAAVYLLWTLVLQFKKGKVSFNSFAKSYRGLSKIMQVVLVTIALVSSLLVAERLGGNYVRYHTLLPTCERVIGPERCQAYSIYRRGQIYANSKPSSFNKSPLYFSYNWTKHMLFNLMMAINGPASGYSIGLPLPLPYIAMVVLLAGGLLLSLIIYSRDLFKQSNTKLVGFMVLVYLASLWFLNYKSYLDTGRRVAVQGRYLVPLLPFILTFCLMAYSRLLSRWPQLKTALAAILVVSFLAGGGVLTFILHSDLAWYWPDQTAINMNHSVQTVFRPIIPGSSYRPYWQTSLQF